MSDQEEHTGDIDSGGAGPIPTTPLHRPSAEESIPVNDSESEADEPLAMGFLDHLEELRKRLIKMILGIVVGASVALVFGEEIFQFVIRPLGEQELHVTTVTGSFYSYLTVSIFAGVFAVLPFLFCLRNYKKSALIR